jgi:hypothetical protein
MVIMEVGNNGMAQSNVCDTCKWIRQQQDQAREQIASGTVSLELTQLLDNHRHIYHRGEST